ncbi:hypothetical protein CWR48_15885 [Oceanobacillus arenosus]|uniref:Uncharacterized protein n=1 Tax=Oceanobacillus arenosus TaxID=1229153 RepID=A0A3D8PKF5_9BACI|nr:hypothetical protein CWR48_15885 [Oceanobacillus arenosus]
MVRILYKLMVAHQGKERTFYSASGPLDSVTISREFGLSPLDSMRFSLDMDLFSLELLEAQSMLVFILIVKFIKIM